MPTIFYQNCNYFVVRTKEQRRLVSSVEHCFVSGKQAHNATNSHLPFLQSFFHSFLLYYRDCTKKSVISLVTYGTVMMVNIE